VPEGRPPDLVLSDMIMPEMDGIKLLDWLRSHDPEVPVIMVTAIHDISTRSRLSGAALMTTILKPFEKRPALPGSRGGVDSTGGWVWKQELPS